VIGLGRMGKLHFLSTLRFRDLRLVAVADKSRKNREVAERYHVKAYDDYRNLIDSEDLDAVVISLPNFLKKECIAYASEKDLDVFVDKPLARNLAEAEEIARKVRAENSRLMVGVNYRYFDSVQKLKRMVDEGRVGDVVLATSELIMDGPFSHPLIPAPVPEWWFDKEMSGGGALIDLGYHLVDIFNWMFGDLNVEFSALGYRFGLPIEDSATVVLKSAKTGVRCVVNTGWFSKMIFPNFNFRVGLHGTVGYASTDKFAPRNLYYHAVKEAASNFLRRASGRRVRYLSYTYYYASFTEILRRFFDSLMKNEELPVPLGEQVQVVGAIDSVYKHNAKLSVLPEKHVQVTGTVYQA
jgi:myo-inositol 2-dehydrogenase/D-chiro-inositol 1-dehydrogenase